MLTATRKISAITTNIITTDQTLRPTLSSEQQETQMSHHVCFSLLIFFIKEFIGSFLDVVQHEWKQENSIMVTLYE